jgi:hypothetical protein
MGLADLVVVWLTLRLPFLPFFVFSLELYSYLLTFYPLFPFQDSEVADDDVIASPVRKDAPQAAAVDQDEDMGKSTAGSSEAGDESMGEEHFSSSDSLFDSTPSSLPEDQIVSAGSTADDDDMSEADDSSMRAAGSTEEELAIVPYAGHDDDSAVDADVDPNSFSLPQTVLTRAGMP